jgi:hypothetical protein
MPGGTRLSRKRGTEVTDDVRITDLLAHALATTRPVDQVVLPRHLVDRLHREMGKLEHRAERAEARLAAAQEYAETSDDDGIRTRETVLRILAGKESAYDEQPAPGPGGAGDQLGVSGEPEFPLPIRPDGTHWYYSCGCLHGDMILPDGRTGHEYCQGETGAVGAKTPAQCKFCGAPCRCKCHREAPTPVGESDPDCTRRPNCDTCDGYPENVPDLTREELQGLVDDLGQEAYRAQDLIAFVREMCDAADRDGSPVTTERVRGWLGYTGCGGMLTLPEGVLPIPTAEAACGFLRDRWDGPYRLRDRCTGPVGHAASRTAEGHGPWEMLAAAPAPAAGSATREEQQSTPWIHCFEGEPGGACTASLAGPDLGEPDGGHALVEDESDAARYVPPVGEATPEEAVRMARDLAERGVDTPGCDCGHGGIGVSWHARDCAWWVTQPVDNPIVIRGHRQCRACDHTITPDGTCTNGCAQGREERR